MTNEPKRIEVIGAGLAGCEAALVLARHGASVDLYEMRPGRMTPAHKSELPAELVCSNSFKAQGSATAHSLLKDELAMLESPLLTIARQCAVPAGSALAVDREQFSRAVQEVIAATPRIRFIREERSAPSPEHALTVIAAGPLASDAITGWIAGAFTSNALSFYDAIAPIVSGDSIDMSVAFFAERDNPQSTDYINCPFTKAEFQLFYDELIKADTAVAREFEQASFFEACLPIEVLARRGFRSLTFGPLKPIGLTDPRTGRWPFAVCQLRRENKAGDSYNLVGFQTRLRIPEQDRVFRLIPGLAGTEFLRYGSIHRNTYLDSPRLLAADLSFKAIPDVFLAGQICGSEGYTESIATGHLAARFALARLRGVTAGPPPVTSAIGALHNHVTCSSEKKFSPSNVNFGLFPAIESETRRKVPRQEKQKLLCERAKTDLAQWMKQIPSGMPD